MDTPPALGEEQRFARGEPFELPRLLGDVEGARPGPIVVLIGGLHGNEPAGALAIRRVLAELAIRRSALSGRVVGLAGNRGALARDIRFVSDDLNRRWRAPDVHDVTGASLDALGGEAREQRELLDVLTPLEQEGRLSIIDLHTTSGPSDPFVCFGDTLENRRVALALPITSVLGLEEIIDGSLLGYYADRGHVAVAVEGGRHRDPATVERHVAALWVTLVTVGSLAERDVVDLPRLHDLLARDARGRPRVVEVRHRHVVREGDAFVMEPGFSSFQPVRKGEVIARDRSGPVRAPESGLMLMPRYQGQGEDGYFVVREVAPVWLRISETLRRMNAHRVVSRLPGVRRDGTTDERLVVDGRVARSFAVELMHLCGYRRARADRDGWVFVKRTATRGCS